MTLIYTEHDIKIQHAAQEYYPKKHSEANLSYLLPITLLVRAFITGHQHILLEWKSWPLWTHQRPTPFHLISYEARSLATC